MALANNTTGAAALGIMLTGASAPLGAQTGQRAALGGYLSSTAVQSLIPTRTANALPGIWIEEVAGANGPGVGVLTVISETQMTWAIL